MGLIILRLDSIIPKRRIILNVDIDGLDPVIPKGRIVQDIDVSVRFLSIRQYDLRILSDRIPCT